MLPEQTYKFIYSKSTEVSLTDLLLTIWLFFCLLRSFGGSSGFDNLQPYLFIFGCYIAVRFLQPCPRILFWGIIGLGFWQSLLAIVQAAGWMASNHRLFDITGSFGNPGQLGGFLAVSIVCTLCVGLQRSKKNWIGFIPLLLIQAYALILSDSRAAWVATICGCLFLTWHYTASYRTRIGASWLLKTTLCLLLAAVLWGLYLYKPHSANGRLLAWRVTANMITDKPVFGHGIGSFGREYMHYQAAYFEKHPDSPYQQYADNITYPYNEFLYAWAEQGTVGVLLFLGLLVGALCTPATNKTYKGALIAYLVFAQFSYPSQVPGLLALFPVLLAAIQSRPLSVRISRGVYWGFVTAALCCAGYVGKEYVFRKQCRATIQDLFSSSAPKAAEAEKFAADHYRRLLAYPRIADVYAQYAFQHYDPQEALAILGDVKKVVPTSELYCDLGDLYKTLGDFDSARNCYRTAGNMIPRRLTPKYKLFVLFRDMGDTLSARRQAAKILDMPIRLEGTRTLKMKAEVRQFMTTPQ